MRFTFDESVAVDVDTLIADVMRAYASNVTGPVLLPTSGLQLSNSYGDYSDMYV